MRKLLQPRRLLLPASSPPVQLLQESCTRPRLGPSSVPGSGFEMGAVAREPGRLIEQGPKQAARQLARADVPA